MGLEKLGRKDESAVKAVGAFAGGIASTGNVCGIALGGVAVISCLYSRGNLEEKEDSRMGPAGRKFLREFEKLAEPFGGMNCSDIARVNWQDRDAARKYYTDPESSRQACIRLVGDAACALGMLLEEEEKSKQT